MLDILFASWASLPSSSNGVNNLLGNDSSCFGFLRLTVPRRALVFFVTGIIPFIVVATIIYRSAPPYGTILDCVPICFGVGLSCSCAWPYLSQRIRDQLAAFSLSWLARDSSSDSTAFDSTRT
ncbi:hypothetical protein IWX91DRAFT_61142 [Phyllosticta citricarpa]